MSSITKHKSIYDPTAGDDYDAVGAYLRSSDGTHLTHTTAGAKEALDVNIAASDIQIEVDMNHTEDDSLRLGNGTDFLTSTSENGDISLDVHISNTSVPTTDAGFTGCNNPAAVAVAATATDIVATEFANRKEITLQNTGTKDCYIGCDSGVTTAKGILLPKGATGTFRFGPSIDIHAIADTGGTTVRVLELS